MAEYGPMHAGSKISAGHASLRNGVVDNARTRGALFYIALFMYSLGVGLAQTTWSMVDPDIVAAVKLATQVVSIALIAMKMIRQRYSAGRLLLLTTLLALAVAASRCSDDLSIAWIIVFLLGSEGADFKVAAKTVLVANAIVLCLAVAGSALDLFPDLVMYREGALRRSMGFLQPNNFGSRMLQVVFSLYVIRFGRFSFVDYLAVFACMAIVWATSISRTSVYLMLLVLLFAMPASKTMGTPRHARRFAVASVTVLLLLLCLSCYFMVSYDAGNPIHAMLNDVLSNRLYLMNFYFRLYPPTMLGQYLADALVPMQGYSAIGFALDNAYGHVIELNGWLLAAVFMVAYLALYLRTYREGVYPSLMALLTLYAVAGFAEVDMLLINANIALLGLSIFVFGGSLSSFSQDCVIAGGARPGTDSGKQQKAGAR